ncbi:hypothetical protein B566_EDAN002186 [Ephemera danica]|nr:hypothetical protein B566_EDAN002186 [Ephemera danica]
MDQLQATDKTEAILRQEKMTALRTAEEEANKPTPEKISKIVNEISRLTNQQRRKLKQILIENIAAFNPAPGIIKDFEYEIKVSDETPLKQASYPVALKNQASMDIAIQKMLEWGKISKESTPYINPLIPVEKKDGGVRPCLDARKLNKRIIPDYDRPMPPEEILQRFHGCKFYSTLDATIPFGLSTSVASLNRCLHEKLGAEILEYTTIYVDDLLIATQTFDEHVKQLEKLLKKLIEIGMTVKLAKTLLCREEVPFIGHILTPTGIRVDERRIQGINDFPRPDKKNKLQEFLGITGCTPFELQHGVSPRQELSFLVNEPPGNAAAADKICIDKLHVIAQERMRKRATKRKEVADANNVHSSEDTALPRSSNDNIELAAAVVCVTKYSLLNNNKKKKRKFYTLRSAIDFWRQFSGSECRMKRPVSLLDFTGLNCSRRV